VTPKTKAESPQALVETIERLERQSDTCYQGLQLLDRQWNYAAWLALTECLRRFESSLTPDEYGSGKHKIIGMNLGRAAGQMWKFAREYARPDLCAPSGFNWYPRVARECAIAFDVAWPYSMFCIDFPAWHRGLYAAELDNATTIRFHSGSSELAKRVSAYQKGIRPGTYASRTSSSPLDLPSPTLSLKAIFDEALRKAKGQGRIAVNFGAVKRLRTALAKMYAERLSGAFRRYPNISVGDYTLEQFRLFYAALLAIVGAHEHLCFLWSRFNETPLESLILVYPRLKWIDLISEYSGLAASIIECVIPDLVFGASPSQDLQMTPLVPLASDNSLLAVAPAFPLQSNWEENILRVCSYLRPKIYSQTSLTKEEEMRDHLMSVVKLPRRVSGPLNLGKGIPDLDLVIEDSLTGTVVFAELKWPRKPYSPREIPQRDSELRKGIAQIKAIKLFLTANPTFLAERHYLDRSLCDYQQVQYCVVSRDHLVEAQDKEYPVYGYDVFEREMSGPKDIPSVLALLNSMDWLPREGNDFTCQWIANTAGGVTVLSELFLLKERNASITTT
jgi:hypothetical protein